MSTRANIVIKQGTSHLIFYRHSDGYPEMTGESLKKFVAGYGDKMRKNLVQSAGWLVVHGREEYKNSGESKWKVGAYEPTDEFHGDIEFLYVIDLEEETLKGYSYGGLTDLKKSAKKKPCLDWIFPFKGNGP